MLTIFGSVQSGTYFLSGPTRSGTTSGSVWNGPISSRVNARPIRTVLVPFHLEPFSCKRGRSTQINLAVGNNYLSSTCLKICTFDKS